jgi:hypothetical protein
MGVGRRKARVVDVADAERAQKRFILTTDERGASSLVLEVRPRADEDERADREGER